MELFESLVREANREFWHFVLPLNKYAIPSNNISLSRSVLFLAAWLSDNNEMIKSDPPQAYIKFCLLMNYDYLF